MTTQILIRHEKAPLCSEYYVHEEHETDFLDLLEEYPNKQEIAHPFTRFIDEVEWFFIELTSEDVKAIKETCWFKNHKHDFPQIDGEITEGAIIEALIIKYIPKEE